MGTLLHDGFDATNTVVFFTDGSEEAYTYLSSEILSPSWEKKRIGVIRTPQFQIQVDGPTDRSHPHFVLTEDLVIRWLIRHLVIPRVSVALHDKMGAVWDSIPLDEGDQESLFYHSYKLWRLLLCAESRLVFPAVVLDYLLSYSVLMKADVFDIKRVQQETGLTGLDYHGLSQTLSITIGGDIKTVTLSTLDALFGMILLPYLNRLYGRRFLAVTSLLNDDKTVSQKQTLTMGRLGELVTRVMQTSVITRIEADNPIAASDGLLYMQKAVLDDTSCLWAGPDDDLSSWLETLHPHLVPRHTDANTDDAQDPILGSVPSAYLPQDPPSDRDTALAEAV
jgi:hypothetical protein